MTPVPVVTARRCADRVGYCDDDIGQIADQLANRVAILVQRDRLYRRRVAGLPDPLRLAEIADEAMFSTGPRADEAMGVLAQLVAVLACQPGGLDFARRHWCSSHAVCEFLAARGDTAPWFGVRR